MNKKFLSAILFGALAVTSTGSFVSCKDYDDDIDNLQTQINGLASAKDLSDKVGALQSAISSAQTAAEAKAAAAQVVADAAKAAADKAGADAADVKKALDAAVADLEAKGATKEELEAAKAVAAEAAAAAQKAGEDAAAAVKAVEEKLEAVVEAAATAQETADEAKALAAEAKAALANAAGKDELAGVAAKVAAAAAALEAKADVKTVEALDARVKALEEAIPGLDNEEAVKALAALATDLSKDVEEIATKLGVISKRLTSVVFAPTTYINGIEAIEFLNLNYRDWSTDPKKWLQDYSTYSDNGKEYKQVEDYGAKVQYMVSPDGVTMKGIKDTKFILNDATNTRAAAAKDVELAFLPDLEIVDGKLTGYVKKTVKKNQALPNASEHKVPVYLKDENGEVVKDNNDNPVISHYTIDEPENLIIASLKATLDESVLTAEEKEANAEVSVYSDWTRINEAKGTPKIHTTLPIEAKHFWKFTLMYYTPFLVSDDLIPNNSKTSKEQAVYTLDDEFYGIAKNQVYNEPLNLYDLVTVCVQDDDQNDFRIIKDYTRYGLEYEFHLMDYKVRNMNPTNTDITNQKDFANLSEDGILTSRNEDGTLTNNKVAIGRTPLIQAVLKDTNKNAVVDVKYFKIKWVEKNQETNPWDKAFQKVAPWQCSVKKNGIFVEDYKVYILEKEMNDFYANIVDGGIDKNLFHTLYPKLSDIYLGDLTEDVKNDILSQTDPKGDFTVGTTPYISIGSADWEQHLEATIQTQNVVLNYTFINPRVDANKNGVEERKEDPQADQNFTKKGYFWFISQDGTNRIFVPVEINVKEWEYELAVEKEPAQWNTAQDVRIINPQLRSDKNYGSKNYKTTQMIGSLQAGYYINAKDNKKPMPETIEELLKRYYENEDGEKVYDDAALSDIVFDGAKLNTLPARKTTKKVLKNGVNAIQDCEWHIENYGKELWSGCKVSQPWEAPKYEDDYLAAAIDEEGNIYLIDNEDNTTNGLKYNEECDPNVASLLLVGKNVPVKVVAQRCVDTKDHESYDINFLTPLKFVGLNDVLHVYDITNGGSSAMINLNSIYLQENFGNNSGKIIVVKPTAPTLADEPKESDFADAPNATAQKALYEAALKEYKEVIIPAYNKQYNAYKAAEAAYSDPVNESLTNWYGVNSFLPLIEEATTDLLTPGKFETKLIDITLAGSTEDDVLPKYALNYKVLGKEEPVKPANLTPEMVGYIVGIIFENLSGNAIQQDINIRIPLSVDTKWQKPESFKQDDNNCIKVTIHQKAK